MEGDSVEVGQRPELPPSDMRQTHTYVTLDIPREFFELVRQRMDDAGYDHLLIKEADGKVVRIDMHGIALVLQPQESDNMETRVPTDSGYEVPFVSEAPQEALKPLKHHPSVEHVLKFFEMGDFTPPVKKVAGPFRELAHHLVGCIPPTQELTVALRKLLEAKEAAVRARLCKVQP